MAVIFYDFGFLEFVPARSISHHLNCASALKIHTQHPEEHQIPTKPSTICLIIYKHFKHTKVHRHARCCVGLWGRNTQQEQKSGLIY